MGKTGLPQANSWMVGPGPTMTVVLLLRSQKPLVRHPGLEPGSIPQVHERMSFGAAHAVDE
jgi:hypothetical protein